MMRLNLEFKTRTWRLTKYKKTFKGGDLVDWLTKHLKLSREDAVAFGEVRKALIYRSNIVLPRPSHHHLLRTVQEMMRRSIFHHVTFSEPFDDEPNLFRFYQVFLACHAAVLTRSSISIWSALLTTPMFSFQDEKKYRTATRAKLRQSTLSADRVRGLQSAQGSSGSGSFSGGMRPVNKVSSGRDVRERYRDV